MPERLSYFLPGRGVPDPYCGVGAPGDDAGAPGDIRDLQRAYPLAMPFEGTTHLGSGVRVPSSDRRIATARDKPVPAADLCTPQRPDLVLVSFEWLIGCSRSGQLPDHGSCVVAPRDHQRSVSGLGYS